MAQICFLGVGKMGLPMASHLLQVGHTVAVSDPSSERLALAQNAGLALADAGTLGQADFVFSSLPHDAALLAVGEQVAQGARPGAVYVDTSTVSLGASARVAELCQVRGVQYLRTTVSGNNKMAEAAQLTVMASGPRDAFDAAQPLLSWRVGDGGPAASAVAITTSEGFAAMSLRARAVTRAACSPTWHVSGTMW
jgi:3-hydroxyisobutyrate dehydrogenase